MNAFRQGACRGARPGRGRVLLAAAALARLHRQQADAVQHAVRQLLDGHPGAGARRTCPPPRHERQHEVLFCYEGEGWAEMDGQRHEVRPETMLLIGRAAWHTVQNTGNARCACCG